MIDLKFVHTRRLFRLLLKLRFRVEFFRFLCLGVVSLPWEWSWAIRLSAAPAVVPYWEPITALMQMLVWRNNIEDGSSPSPGLIAAP
jgi:hypothetical protein